MLFYYYKHLWIFGLIFQKKWFPTLMGDSGNKKPRGNHCGSFECLVEGFYYSGTGLNGGSLCLILCSVVSSSSETGWQSLDELGHIWEEVFKVKSLYKALILYNRITFPWNTIWRSEAPLRAAFVWTAALQTILTLDKFRKRHVIVM